MPSPEKNTPEEVSRVWHDYLTTGKVPEFLAAPWYRSRRFASFYRRLPTNPRCRICHYPFKGLGGMVSRHVFGILPSRLNPQLCNDCERFAQHFQGGAEVELSILFADVRGSTTLAETMPPAQFSRLINRFYNTATKVLFEANAMVEKLHGDAVTGFFTPGMAGPDHALVAIRAAREILRATGHRQPEAPWISVGIGVHTGLAYVGSVNGDSGVNDIAVLGDAANIGARLASQAAAGEIHASQSTARAARLDPSGLEIRQQTLKGRTEPTEVWVLSA